MSNSLDEDYTNHKIFKELDIYSEFYESLSTSIFSFPTVGTTAIANIDTYVYMSIKGTIESIKIVLENGKLNDAYALLRKYYDSAIINAYTNLYLSENNDRQEMYISEINDWLQGKKKLPRMVVMSKYLRRSDILTDFNDLLDFDDRYQKIRERCNDNMHYNSFSLLMINDGRIYSKERIKLLEQLREDIEDIFILNIGYIFLINDYYMLSTDYIDYLDCGMEPPEGSQFWVAPFIKEILSQVLKKRRMDIYELIKMNTDMEIEK